MESEHLIGYTIRALSNLFRRQLMSHQPPDGKPCSETAGMIMGYLCEHVGNQLCQHDIEQVFCIRRSTASRFLIALEKEEMIERVSAPNDARRKIIVPTEKALAIHAQFIAQRDALEAQITRGIPREEVEAFLATAKKIQANLAELPQQKE